MKTHHSTKSLQIFLDIRPKTTLRECIIWILVVLQHENPSNQNPSNSWLLSCCHKNLICQARHAVIWLWRTGRECRPLVCGFFFESVSGHPLSVWIKTCSVPESMPAIFANGSSLRDLRCRDTGQLEKRKHRSLERCAERFTVNRAAFCEIESGIRMCWWSDTVEVVHTMSSSSWCYWWPHYILSQPDCGVTDTSALCLYCGLSAFNNWVNQRYYSCNSIHLLLGSKFRIQHF